MPTSGAWEPWRLGAFYATYFAAAGVLAPYFPLYLEARGLTAAQIGVLTALAQGLRVVGPTFWGWLADRTSRRVAVVRLTTFAAFAAFLPILLPGGFGFVFVVMFVFHFFLTGQVPTVEAIAAVQLRNDPNAAGRYGRLRVWGSIGFIVFVLATGMLLDRVGLAVTPYVVLGLLAAIFASARLLREAPAAESGHERVSVRARLREPAVRWFFASALLMIFAHSAFYAYFSLYLARLGYSKTAIGAFWVIGVVIEIGLFATQGRLFRTFDVLRLAEASIAVAAVRFFLIAEFAEVLLALALAQAMHAVTFAVHHSSCILTIQRWFPGRAAARGQALYVSIGYGLGGSVGGLVAAWLWTAVSPSAAFLSSSAAALFGWLAVRRAREYDRVGLLNV